VTSAMSSVLGAVKSLRVAANARACTSHQFHLDQQYRRVILGQARQGRKGRDFEPAGVPKGQRRLWVVQDRCKALRPRKLHLLPTTQVYGKLDRLVGRQRPPKGCSITLILMAENGIIIQRTSGTILIGTTNRRPHGTHPGNKYL
jgi:hypothetical protein